MPNDSPLRSSDLKARFAELSRLPEEKKGWLSQASLSQTFDFLHQERGLLLAISGGPDSLALLLLCFAWRQSTAPQMPLHIATVDHGLRQEARDEAEYVGKIAQLLDIPHTILVWQAEKPLSGIQQSAREARYGLLAEHAKKLGLNKILTAHHRDDQEETFLMRLLHGSGPSGLSCMQSRSRLGDVEIVRPLLVMAKHDLVEIVSDFGVRWCDDPSNSDERFDRVRLRKQILPALRDFAKNTDWVSATTRRMARADAALSMVTQDYFDQNFRSEAGRALSCDLAFLVGLPEEFRLRLLQQVIFHVAGGRYPCKDVQMRDLDCAIRSLAADKFSAEPGSSKTRGKWTLADCCYEVSDERLWIYRELGRKPVNECLKRGDSYDWMGIYDVSWPQLKGADETVIEHSPSGESAAKPSHVTLRPLGRDGRIGLAQEGLHFASRRGSDGLVGKVPYGLIEALPSVWSANRPVFVVEWSEVEDWSGFTLDFLEKNTRFTKK